MDRRVYRSKVDPWLGALLGGMTAAYAVVGVALLLFGPAKLGLPLAVVLWAAAAFAASTLFATRYTLDDAVLVVRSGPFSWRVPVGLISRAVPTRTLMSGPALSLDRLEIDYGAGRSILISPADRGGFLADLESRRRALADA